MRFRKSTTVWLALCVIGTCASLCAAALCRAASGPDSDTQQAAAQSPPARSIGTIKAINGTIITLTPDSGPDITVQVQDSTLIVRIAPGVTDLKLAVPMKLQGLQVGDRVRVRGNMAADNKSMVAISIIAIKAADVQAKQEQEREDWQKRGVGGIVKAVAKGDDANSGTITITTGAAATSKAIAITVNKATILRRYAPDSVKFDDAKTIKLDGIRPGDQLRARGARNADGSEVTAEEIVAGAFRNIAGTISAIDAAAGTISVMDLATKKPVVVKITADSQLRQLPQMMAMRIAVRLKAGAAGAQPGAGGATTNVAVQSGATAPSGAPAGAAGGTRAGAGGGAAGGGTGDMQQILSRIPAVTLADLKTGDAIMMVSTEGTASGQVTAIMLLTGVEPILAAAPVGSQAMTLSPWSLGAIGEDAGTP